MENQNNLLKKVFTKEEKEHYISRWQAGGKSKMKFAAENGLKYYTFVNWCHTLLLTKPVAYPLLFSIFQPFFSRAMSTFRPLKSVVDTLKSY